MLSESTLLPLCEMKAKASHGRKASSIVNIRLLPLSTHVLTPRHWSHKQLLAAAGSSTEAPATPWGCSLALRCRRPQLPVQGRLCSQLTAAVTSSRDVASERLLGEKAVSPQRDKGTGSCWGQAGESPAATAWGSWCPPALQQERCPGCSGSASCPSASPASRRSPGRQGAALDPPASSTSPQRRHVGET